MSRYDGLIIPRSYNDYFSRSRPEDARALAATMTESTFNPAGSVPVNGQAVNNALTDITKGIPLTETDLDNVKTEGLYVSNQNTVYTNTPHSTGMYFSLHVIRTNNLSATGYKQIVHLYSSNQTFERVWTYSSGTGMYWEPWVKVVTKTDIPYYNTTFTLTESELGYLEASFQNADNYTIFQGTTTAGYELGWQGFKHTDSKVCFIIGYSRQYGVFSGKRSTNGNWEFRNIINY